MSEGRDRSRSKLKLVVVGAFLAILAVPTAVFAGGGFTDVDETNVFSDDITWLATAGVTKGCNPPDNTEFCPSDTVTRQQMAAFMRRFAAFMDAEDGTPAEADNAATVGGLDTDELRASLAGSDGNGSPVTLTSGDNTTIEEITVTAPVDGYLMILGSASWVDTDNAEILQWIQVDNTTCSNGGSDVQETAFGYGSTGDGRLDHITVIGHEEVTAGDHTVTLCAREFAGGFDPQYYAGTIQTIFNANGETIVSVASAPAGSLLGTD